MTLDIEPIINAIESHALATGYFDAVNTHEPKSSPGHGMSAAIWRQTVRPARGRSGLHATSVEAEFRMRIYTNMLQEPQDMIDINMSKAEDAMMNRLHGDFTLGGTVKNIELTSDSNPLRGEAGYVNQDGKMFRIITIFIPVIINDVWEQVA